MNRLVMQPPSVFPPDFDYRPSGERANQKLDSIRAEALATAADPRSEADRLAAALAKATAEHGQATAELDRLEADLERAIIDGADVAAAEKRLADAPAKIAKLARRVDVLKDAADRAAKDADEAETVAYHRACWAHLPAAKEAVEAAGADLQAFDERMAAERLTFLRALADTTTLANRLKHICVPTRSIFNGVERANYARGIEPPAGVTP
ncbi:MAG TPA: hypothetical protein VM529_22675 [Gemmata sp.]|jgi:hypothetical protein|nr:hypothetical protein [Gemmata sp.]